MRCNGRAAAQCVAADSDSDSPFLTYPYPKHTYRAARPLSCVICVPSLPMLAQHQPANIDVQNWRFQTRVETVLSRLSGTSCRKQSGKMYEYVYEGRWCCSSSHFNTGVRPHTRRGPRTPSLNPSHTHSLSHSATLQGKYSTFSTGSQYVVAG